MAEQHDAWITGIGLVSSLGEGNDAHWAALQRGQPHTDATAFAPYLVHPLAPVNFDTQIPKKGDQRQMEAWQRIGTYAAGLALDSAGIKGNAEILARADMIVAAGGGERDIGVDTALMTALINGNQSEAFLNERLMSDLRPTLFLAQLSNLLAGNISIVHGVTGSSRTFMGEEEAGVDAVRIALARIASGQSDLCLVGAALNGEREDLLMLYECGGFAMKDTFAPVWSRGPKGGFALGSAGAFLVIESRAHAERRGARPYARLRAVVADHTRRANTAITGTLERLWQSLAPQAGQPAVLTAASGAEPATAEERRFLEAHRDVAVRGLSTLFGNTLEAQFPLAVALAALALSRGELFAPLDPSGLEQPCATPFTQAVAVCAGHWRGEGMALLERAE
jgi:3-oxoacyl-[acyl-carrier-protein] synthase II